MVYITVVFIRFFPKRYSSFNLSVPFSIPFDSIIKIYVIWKTYNPTTIWKKKLGIISFTVNNELIKDNVEAVSAAASPAWNSWNCVPSCTIILTIIDAIPITIPAIAGVKNEICDFIEEMISDNRSFNLSFTLWILST